jgi:hypothetical protein
MFKCMRLGSSISSLSTHLIYRTEGYHAPQNRQTQCWHSVILQFCRLSLFCFEELVSQVFLHSVRLWLWLDYLSSLHHSHLYCHFWTLKPTHTQHYKKEHCSCTEHTCADESVHLVHLLPTEKRITDHCFFLVQFLSFTTMFTAS